MDTVKRVAQHATAEDGPYVRFANVQKTYDGENLVVTNLKLDIAKGEFLTMPGPSGSGKATSLMTLAGFETATRGESSPPPSVLSDCDTNRLSPPVVCDRTALWHSHGRRAFLRKNDKTIEVVFTKTPVGERKLPGCGLI